LNEAKVIRCEGCGVTIQSEDPGRIGFVPPQALKRETVYCQRCFRIRHYGDIGVIQQDPDVYLQKLDEIAQTDSLVVQIVDLFDFAGSWIPGIHRHIGRNPLLLVANKVDLFPPSTKFGRLREWLLRSAADLGIRPVDVVLCSSTKGIRITEAMDKIERNRRGRDVYIVGATNTGKSTFLNRLLCELGLRERDVITTSPYPGTTLDTIRIPLPDGKAIIDTPGIVRKERISEWLSPQDLKIVVPDSTLRPKVYQLNDRQTLFFGGLARFDFVEGKHQPFVCHMSNRLYIHRTKLEHADEFQRRHLGELLSPPKDPASLPAWKRHRFTLQGQMKQDIVIPGLGWIAGGLEKAVVDVWAPEGIQVSIRPAIL
jgi:ribosome biogenesis GTPase YqeH